MVSRLPEYFQLDKYNIAPEDIVRSVLRCDPDTIQPRVIVTPVWGLDSFFTCVDGIKTVSEGIVYQLQYHGHLISVIKSGIGAPQTGDVILALGCTPCDIAVFTGSVGGLDPSMKIGDLILAEKSLSGDGFCRYLDSDIQTKDCFLHSTKPDLDLTRHVRDYALRLCQTESVSLHCGTIFSIDSIIAQFFRLDYFANSLHCIGIEMETSAVFRAAELIGIRACALLQVSDVLPVNKSLFSGRTADDKKRRLHIRKTILSKIILDLLVGVGC